KIGLVSQEYDTDSRYVLIRMALYSDVFLVEKSSDKGKGLQELIDEGLRVRLNFQGVTGTAYIEADYLEAKRYPRLK
ncbi:MAG: ABC transporter substrate-binding protein, partial [Desulfuromonadales bacterium]|nr:ABC transporter substrate-binding protein [Desulfuromonadales bacterium]NIS43574.1 ABC transporter substrate-binding protein [Desulfuromonadales bacterium]